MYYQGGGACWSGATCELDIYTRRVTVDPELARQQALMNQVLDTLQNASEDTLNLSAGSEKIQEEYEDIDIAQ